MQLPRDARRSGYNYYFNVKSFEVMPLGVTMGWLPCTTLYSPLRRINTWLSFPHSKDCTELRSIYTLFIQVMH